MKTFISPISVLLPRARVPAKRVYLNLNVFRNLNRFTNNETKVLYSKLMSEQLQGTTFKRGISITYVLHRGNKRKGDRMNVLSIVDKFFCDALQNHNCIPDDDDSFIDDLHFYTGYIDKTNPRVDITIEERDDY